jgi:hypothetical protein
MFVYVMVKGLVEGGVTIDKPENKKELDPPPGRSVVVKFDSKIELFEPETSFVESVPGFAYPKIQLG